MIVVCVAVVVNRATYVRTLFVWQVRRLLKQLLILVRRMADIGTIAALANLTWCYSERIRVWFACLPLLMKGRTALNRVRVIVVIMIGLRLDCVMNVTRLLSRVLMSLGCGGMNTVLCGSKLDLLT